MFVNYSIDIESSDKMGKGSMLSLGACVVGDYSKKFYREMQPLDRFDKYTLDAMKIACLGLKCLSGPVDNRLKPETNQFNPDMVMRYMSKYCDEPKEVMKDFVEWVNLTSGNNTPVVWARPIKYDGGFISLYCGMFDLDDPFRHTGEDIGSYYKGRKNDLSASFLEEIEVERVGTHHNALDDAITQAKKLEAILGM